MRILLVEDDNHLAAAIGRGLRADGSAVGFARAGSKGLWRADEAAYEAIVLDIMLPEVKRIPGPGEPVRRRLNCVRACPLSPGS